MSARDDFYTPRRGAMADTGAYTGFLLGFFGAAPLGWRALMASFEDTGDATMGVIRFAGTLVVVGLAAGAIGYVLGALAGRVWESRHRAANPVVKPEAGPDRATLTAAPPEETVAAVARAWQRQARAAAAGSEAGTDAGIARARFDAPHESRERPGLRVALVRLPGGVIGRATCAPGWRWSADTGANDRVALRTDALEAMVLSGALDVVLGDGRRERFEAGDLVHLPPHAHDLATAGGSPLELLLLRGAERFAP